MPLIKPQITKPQVGGDLNTWGNKLNEIIDKFDNFNSKVVEDSNTQNGELSRLEQNKISKTELDGFVSNKVDNYINEYGKAIIDEHVDTISKPDLSNYVEGKKSEINQYVESVSKPAINSHVDEKKLELDKYNEVKKSELDSHTVVKENQLNDYTIVKKSELDAHEKEKEKELDAFTSEKKIELTAHVNSEVENVTAHADAKKIEIDNFTDEQKAELDSYEKSKESELNTHTTKKKEELDTYTLTKNGELDTHTNKKKEELNAHEKLKEGELDSYNATKKTELDKYEKVKEGELNEFTITKKTEITEHSNSEKTSITSHANSKKVEISEYTDTKKSELDTYEKEKESELLVYTNNKKGDLDTYTESKKGDLDAHVVKSKKNIDDYIETTSKPTIQGFVDTKVEESNQSITNHTNAEIERLQSTGLSGKLDKGNYVGTAEDLNNEIKKKATIQQLQEELQKIIGNSPETLDTLQEIATALGNDPNFATTMTNLLSQKLEKGTYEGTASDLKSLIDSLSSSKQDKNDETLLTQSKAIVGAINEIKRKNDSLVGEKQDKIDNTLLTEAKTISGSINELKNTKVDNTTYNSEISSIRDDLATKPAKATQIIAGKGLTGGGTLGENVTLNIESTSRSLVISDNSIGLELVNDLVTGGVDRIPSAETIVVLNRKIDALEGGGSSSEIGQGENFGERRFKGVLEGNATDINLGTLIYHPELYLDGTRIAKEMYVADLRTGHIKLNKVYSAYSVDYEIIDRYPFHIKFAYPTLNLLISQTQIKDSIKLGDVIKILGETTEDDGGARLVKCEDSKKLNGIDIGEGRFLNEVPESRIGAKLDKGGYSGNAQDLKNDIDTKQNSTDNSLNTSSKNVVGAINEVNSSKVSKNGDTMTGNIHNSNNTDLEGLMEFTRAGYLGLDRYVAGIQANWYSDIAKLGIVRGPATQLNKDCLKLKLNNDFYTVFHEGNCPILKGETGWQKLASGLIIQWGVNIATPSWPQATYTFPIAFNKFLIGFGNTDGSDLFSRVVSSNGINFGLDTAWTSEITNKWIAIGY